MAPFTSFLNSFSNIYKTLPQRSAIFLLYFIPFCGSSQFVVVCSFGNSYSKRFGFRLIKQVIQVTKIKKTRRRVQLNIRLLGGSLISVFFSVQLQQIMLKSVPYVRSMCTFIRNAPHLSQRVTFVYIDDTKRLINILI